MAKISIIVCLLQFAELFACVLFGISLFAEVYHEFFDSTIALRNIFLCDTSTTASTL